LSSKDVEPVYDPARLSVPDQRPLKSFIAGMPGGGVLRKRWRDGPPVIVGVWLHDSTMPELAARVYNAFPPVATPGFRLKKGRTVWYGDGGLLMRVPQFCADLLTWPHLHGPDSATPQVVDLDGTAAQDVSLEALALTWHWAEQVNQWADPVPAAVRLLRQVEQTPAVQGLGVVEVLNTAISLAEADDDSFSQLVDAAVTLLRKP
jgi:hypothetical protein